MYISRLPPPLLSFPQALSSLKKYPLPLNNGKEAKILQNFGDGICKILDDRLEKYYRVNGELIFTAYPACTLPSLSLTPRYFIIFQSMLLSIACHFCVIVSVTSVFVIYPSFLPLALSQVQTHPYIPSPVVYRLQVIAVPTLTPQKPPQTPKNFLELVVETTRWRCTVLLQHSDSCHQTCLLFI